MGWFTVAMADVLEKMPEYMAEEREELKEMFCKTIEDLQKFQNPETGMFWQIINRPGVYGNYLETSGSALFAYAVLKGTRLGYLPKEWREWGEKAFYGICADRLSKGEDGKLQLTAICLKAGLGDYDHSDGSMEYYFSEPVVKNDAKGVGPLLLAYTEIIRK